MISLKKLYDKGYRKQSIALQVLLHGYADDKMKNSINALTKMSDINVRVNSYPEVYPSMSEADVIKAFKQLGVDFKPVKKKWWQFNKPGRKRQVMKAIEAIDVNSQVIKYLTREYNV